MTAIDTIPDDAQINDRERAIIIGHQESKRRLLESPRWDADAVDELLTAVEGYEDFARCVVDELRFDRQANQGDSTG